jgi:hypothetical protein
MSRITGLFTLAGAAALFAFCFVAGSPNLAAAQQADSQGEWQFTPSTSVADSKVPPTDFNGFWCGTIEDNTSGNPGTGFIDFVQSANLKHVTKASSAGLTITGISGGSAPVSGNVKGATFKLQHFGHHCKVALKGGLGTSNDVTGSYVTSKRCFGDGVKHTGSFDFTFEGSSCP